MKHEPSDSGAAERVAFATLTPSCGVVNGVCWRIPNDWLGSLDFREQGYARIDVSPHIAPYSNYELDRSIRCYTYIDTAPDPDPAIVSHAYYNMGYLGAQAITETVPDFFADYLSSTEQPTMLGFVDKGQPQLC